MQFPDDRKADPEVGSHDESLTKARPTAGWRVLTEALQPEAQGIVPIPENERSDPQFVKSFTLWLTMNATIACLSTGALGPLLFELSLRDSALIIVLSNLFSCAVPSYIATFGPRLGMRTMCIARYSYGFIGAAIPALFNVVTFTGFSAVNSIVGGQVLAAVNPGSISVEGGIIIIAIISMVISFLGYRVLHAFERWAWIPVLFAFIMLVGFGGRHLGVATAYGVPATAGTVLSFLNVIVGFSLSWGGCSADFVIYLKPTVRSSQVFFYTFAGLYLPCALIQTTGAAFAAAALSGQVTTWEEAFGDGAIGNLMGVALEPLHGFGKFLLVILALGIITNNAPTAYAFSISTQVVFPFLVRIPRFVFAVVATAIYLPIAIVGAQHFATALNNFLSLIGYWSAVFVVVFIAEHVVFRRARFASYDPANWNSIAALPPGFAALFSSLVGAALVVLGMDQVWWRGPIARAISQGYGGDVAFETAMLATLIAYVPTRALEKRIFKR